jgi:hypothetical protein
MAASSELETFKAWLSTQPINARPADARVDGLARTFASDIAEGAWRGWQARTALVATPKPEKFKAADIVLPDWLPRDVWLTWVDERRRQRKAIGERAAKGQIEFLGQMRDEGIRVEWVIQHAINSGHQGLYRPPREPGSTPQNLALDAQRDKLARLTGGAGVAAPAPSYAVPRKRKVEAEDATIRRID